MKIIEFIFRWFLTFMVMLIGTVGIHLLIVVLQERIFLPEEYLMWTHNYPASMLILLYIGIFYVGAILLFPHRFKTLSKTSPFSSLIKFYKQKRKRFYSTFLLVNIVLLYAITFSVTVITEQKVIDYSFLAPQGKEYAYSDIAKITTGVHGKKSALPYHYYKGQFYYILELIDETKVELDDARGLNDRDHRFILEELDQRLVDMGIPKESSMEHFDMISDLGQVYKDRIENILKNTTMSEGD
ncbi:hypothetical protein [Caldalkalibacillus mannanilyticus]|uniref:hypothetical protein n=1 Tax=Caldalkalibacillus mannanilyticus TaxID=1418 RepID=UPI00046AE7CF|nr:hypothetical protein [Caldalkalibacillus mannanilyticus]